MKDTDESDSRTYNGRTYECCGEDSLSDRVSRSQILESCRVAARVLKISGKKGRGVFYNHARAIRYFGAWYAVRFGEPFAGPMQPRLFYQFVRDHTNGHLPVDDDAYADFLYSPASNNAMPHDVEQRLVSEGFKYKRGAFSQQAIATYLSALRRAWSESVGKPPISSRYQLGIEGDIKQLTAAARRRERATQGYEPHRQTRISAAVHARMTKACGEDLKDIRDRALLWFGWVGPGISPGGICSARIEHLAVFNRTLVLHSIDANVERAGTDPGIEREFVGEAALAINAWLDQLAKKGFKRGPLFPIFTKDMQAVRPMKPHGVTRIVKYAAIRAGLDPACIRGSSLWSPQPRRLSR
jgi:hypothetical protein